MFSMEAMFAEQSERRRWEGVVAEWQTAYEQIKAENRKLRQSDLEGAKLASGYVGYSIVLERALAAVDPGHPLIANGGRNDLARSAVKACENTYGDGSGDLDGRIKRAAESFPLPQRPNVQVLRKAFEVLNKRAEALQAEVARLKAREKQYEAKGWEIVDDLIDHMAQREAMRAEIARYDGSNPLVTNADLRARISKAGRQAYAISNGDFQAVREAGRTFLDKERDHAGRDDSARD